MGLLQIKVLPVIIYNYFTASLLGFVISGVNPGLIISSDIEWLSLSVIIGILFIIMFFIVGKSSEKAGISITTVASKMSVVIPISFSMIADPADKLNIMKILGVITALVAVFLTVYRKRTLNMDRSVMIYPFLLFIGMGIVDSLVKYSQMRFISNSELASFSAVLFLIAFITGILYMFMQRGRFQGLLSGKALVWGILLGVSNFGSIYFLIRALNFKNMYGTGIDSSIVFGVNNTGIVVLSVFAGYLVFTEKLLKINYLGIILSLVAIIIFSYA